MRYARKMKQDSCFSRFKFIFLFPMKQLAGINRILGTLALLGIAFNLILVPGKSREFWSMCSYFLV